MHLMQWSDKCDTSLAVESALCTTGSPRRWSQRVSRKCCESVGAAKDVIMPLPYQLDKAKPSENKIKNAIGHITLGWWFTVSICSTKHHAIAKWCTLFASIGVTRAQKNAPLQWSDKCDTSLAVESALCTTGSPRRWSQRVSRTCYESVGAAKDVIMPLPNQVGIDQKDIMQMQIGTGCVPVGGTCVQDYATHSVIRQMRYLTGCGISPLHHRFTPKMESKGVSEMLWKCRSRKRCHHATPISTWQGKTLWKQIQKFHEFKCS